MSVASAPPVAASALRLPDGRVLGFREYGDPDGRPAFYFHGEPGSRHDGEVVDAVLRDAGVRMVNLERPGYGLSTPVRGRRLADWPQDVRHAADALGIERFAVYGISFGGPYALACAARLADRVDAAGVVSGIGPPAMPGFRDGMDRSDAVLTWLAPRAPALVGLATRATARLARRDPDRLVAAFVRDLDEADRGLVADLGLGPRIAATFAEATRGGPGGIVADYAIAGRRWDVDLASIRVPVRLWHGDRDALIPHRHAEHVAALLPDATLTTVAGAGHLFALDPARWRAILPVLLPGR